MTGKLKKAIASLMAVASLSTCAVGISASAAEQGKFNVHYGVGAPSSENVVSESSSSYVPNTDPAITLYCTLASPSSNVTHCNIKMMNAKYSAEREELQKSINELSEKINVGNKETALAIDKLSYIKSLSKDDLNSLNAEICNNLVEKIIVGETYWTGEVNYGKQQIDIYLYGIGKIGDIVDVSYKTFEERILMVLPELLTTNNYAVSVVCEKLNLPYNVLKKGLQNEGLTFTLVKMKARAMLK